MPRLLSRIAALLALCLLSSGSIYAQFYNVVTYGATGNGSTDDTASINSARSAAETAGGGTVFFPAGTYCISSSITNGNGSTTSSSTVASVLFAGPVPTGDQQGVARLKWCTSTTPGSPTPMIKFQGPILGGGIRDLQLDADNKSNVYGLQMLQQASGKYDGLSIRHVAGREAIQMTTHNATSAYGVCDNSFTRLSIIDPGTGGSGILLDGTVTDRDACSNTIVGAKIMHDGQTSGTHGLKLRYADNNTFIRTNLYATPTGSTPLTSTCGVRFEQYSSATTFPNENSFYDLSAHSGVCGSTGTLTPNKFIGYNLGDCKVNCGPTWRTTGQITTGMAPVAYLTEGKQVLTSFDGSAKYVIAADGYGTEIFSLQRGGPSGSGMQVNSFSEVALSASGGLGVSALKTATSNQLCYNTSAMAGYNALATCSSLSRYKTDIRPLRKGLGLALALKPVSYKSLTSERNEIGLIAEQVASVEPRLATYDEHGKLVGVDYGHLAAVAIQALKEMHERLAVLEGRQRK